MAPPDDPDPAALLAMPPLSAADVAGVELEHSLQRCRDAVDEARRNLRSAQEVLVVAEKAVEQAVMAEAFLRCVAPRDPPAQ